MWRQFAGLSPETLDGVPVGDLWMHVLCASPRAKRMKVSPCCSTCSAAAGLLPHHVHVCISPEPSVCSWCSSHAGLRVHTGGVDDRIHMMHACARCCRAVLCRERCGGQGYLSVNRFGELIGFAHAGMTAEGDNRWEARSDSLSRLAQLHLLQLGCGSHHVACCTVSREGCSMMSPGLPGQSAEGGACFDVLMSSVQHTSKLCRVMPCHAVPWCVVPLVLPCYRHSMTAYTLTWVSTSKAYQPR